MIYVIFLDSVTVIVQERGIFTNTQMQVPLHRYRVFHILVHTGITEECVYGDQKATTGQGPPENTRQQPKQDKDRNHRHDNGSRFLGNLNTYRHVWCGGEGIQCTTK